MDEVNSLFSRAPRHGLSDKTMDDLSAFMEGMTVSSSLYSGGSDKKLSPYNSNMSLTSSQVMIQMEESIHVHSSLAGDLTLTDSETAAAMMVEYGELRGKENGKSESNHDDSSSSLRRTRSDASTAQKTPFGFSLYDCDDISFDILRREAALPPRSDSDSTYKPMSTSDPIFYDDIQLNSQESLDPRSDFKLKPPPFAFAPKEYEDISLDVMDNDDALLNAAIGWQSSRSSGLKLDLSERLPAVTESSSRKCLTSAGGVAPKEIAINASEDIDSVMGPSAPLSTPRSYTLTPPAPHNAPVVTPESRLQATESFKDVGPVTMEVLLIPKEATAIPDTVMVDATTAVSARINDSPRVLFSPSKREEDRVYVAKSEVTEHDVLCGQDIVGTDHPGNLKYYDLVKKYKGEYQATKERRIKAVIRNHVISTVMQKGRFMVETKEKLYYLRTEEQVKTKVSKSLGKKKKAKTT